MAIARRNTAIVLAGLGHRGREGNAAIVLARLGHRAREGDAAIVLARPNGTWINRVRLVKV